MEQHPDHPEDYQKLHEVTAYVAVNIGRYVLAATRQEKSLVTDEPKEEISSKDLALIRSYDLSRISTETDYDDQTAKLLLIGPVQNDKVKTIMFEADISTGSMIADPLELVVKVDHQYDRSAPRAKNSHSFDLNFNMTESREATVEEYVSVTSLLKIASDLSKDPLSHPHNKTMLGIVMEKYIWRMAHLFPVPKAEKNESEALEDLIATIFETQNSLTYSIKSDTLVLKYQGKDGEDKVLAVKDDDKDYLIKLYDPKTKKLETYAVGPFAENTFSDEIVAPMEKEQIESTSKILKTGTPITGDELEGVIEKIEKTEDKMVNHFKPDLFEDEDEFETDDDAEVEDEGFSGPHFPGL